MANAILDRVERFDLAAPDGGDPYAITLLRPEGDFADSSVPIIFITDSDTNFGIAASVAGYLHGLGGAKPAVIVGVGYGVSPIEMAQRRTVDLTPPMAAENSGTVDQLATLIGDERGGAARFLDFILGEVTAEVVRRCPAASASGNMLLGHSLGGLFVAHALLTRPESFSTYFMLSPALWWNDFAELRNVDGFRAAMKTMDDKPALFVAVGGLEQTPPEALPPQIAALGMTLEAAQEMVRRSRMVDAAQEFADMARDAGVARCVFRAYPDEDHGSVIPGAIGRSLLFALKSED